MNVLVVGASRGIGLEFVRQYAEAGGRVVATARDDAGLARVEALGAKALRIDVADAKSISTLGRQLGGEKIDVALYVAGVMSHGGALHPPGQEEFDRVMRTNVWGAMQAIPQVAPLVEAAQGKFVFITSGMGHISRATNSHNWVYRASKSALNMAVVSAQSDYPKAIFAAMSPGWVKTDMGGANAAITADDSVRAMRTVIGSLTSAHKSAFMSHDGGRIESW